MPSFFLDIVGEELVKAISWTFFHSLWQGFLLAILAGIAVLITRKSGPAVRYNILCSLFFAFLIVSGFTFFSQLETADQANGKIGTAPLGSVLNIQQDQSVFNISDGISFHQFFGKCLAYFNEHAYLVVTIWFVVFCAKFIRLMANVSYMQRARNYKTTPAAEYWQERMLKLADSLGIRKNILLLQSQWIKVPMVAGLFKPVILFPFSMLSQLPPDQVEAVLLHELAHIRRRDYFVNLFQSLADTIFFFNPGLIWISSLIRDERENCCDDLALSRTQSNKAFVHALLAFEEFDLNAGSYATGFPGRKNHLLRRVKRILNHNNQTLNTMERIFLGGCLLAITLGSVAFAQQGKQHSNKVQSSGNVSPEKPAVTVLPTSAELSSQSTAATETTQSAASETVQLNDSTPPKKKATGKFIIDEDGVVIYVRDGYRIETKNDKIIAAYFNEVRIPDNQLSEKEPMLRKLIREQRTESMKALEGDKQLLLDQSAELHVLADGNHKELLELEKTLSEVDASRTLEKLKLDQEQLFNKQEHEALELNLLNKLQLDMSSRSLGSLDANSNAVNLALLESKINLLNNSLQLQKDKLALMDQKKLAEVAHDTYNNMIMDAVAPVIVDLMADKIISDTKDLSFELNDQKFTVNKVTQSTTVHKRYKQKYLGGPKDHMSYSISKNGVHADVNRNK